MHRNIGVRDVDVSRNESNRLEEEAERLEQELANIRALRAASVPSDRSDAAVLGGARVQGSASDSAAPTRWRSAVEPADGEEAALAADEEAEDDALAAQMLGAILNAERPRKQRSDSERPHVRRAGEFGSVEAFLGDLNLGRYAALFHERGLDSAEAIAALDPRQLRALVIDNKNAQRLRMGIAELRAFGVEAAPRRAAPAATPLEGVAGVAARQRPSGASAKRPPHASGARQRAMSSDRPPVNMVSRAPDRGVPGAGRGVGMPLLPPPAASGRARPPRLVQGRASSVGRRPESRFPQA